MQFLNCLIHEHDTALVLVAAIVCVLAAFTTFAVLEQARLGLGRRLPWVLLAGIVAGAGIWSTHFIAMLAYRPEMEIGFMLAPTFISVVLAIGLTGLGWAVADRPGKWSGALGGAVAGVGLDAMHYVGMSGVSLPGRMEWNGSMVAASVVIGIGLTSWAAAEHARPRSTIPWRPALIFTLAICGLHFGAMAALTVHPDPSLALSANAIDRRSLTAIVAAVALLLIVFSFAIVLTDQRRLGAELLRVADARAEFLAAMSHEIRTPLTGVLGVVDLFEMDDLTPRHQGYVESIRISGRHLLNVINDILDFSRIETGQIDLECIDFSLPALLGRLKTLLDPLARERGVRLNFNIPADSPPIVQGDPTRLKQVLLNIAGNGIKFCPQGEVDLTMSYTREPEGTYRFRFEVQDTGIGIPVDKQKDLFLAFRQADHSTKRRFGGSGLGLAISKRLIEAMGGEIGFESCEGRGSLFWFEVPLAQGDPVRLPTEAQASRRLPLRRRILLAEDVELNRDIIRATLERDGHEVVIAENGREAVDLACGSSFDIILMDVHMPEMDGLEATRAIRRLPAPVGDLPIVALTANVMAAEQAKCMEAGMMGVVMKPIDWDRLRAILDDLPCGSGHVAAAPSRHQADRSAGHAPRLTARPTGCSAAAG